MAEEREFQTRGVAQKLKDLRKCIKNEEVLEGIGMELSYRMGTENGTGQSKLYTFESCGIISLGKVGCGYVFEISS